METKFVISDVVTKSWECTKAQLWILIGLMIGYIILSIMLSVASIPLQNSIVGMMVFMVINVAISLIFSLGYLKNIFQALDGIEPQFSAYGQQASKCLPFLGASILYGIIVAIGTLCLIIPGIYLAIRLQFFAAFIVEENSGVIESLKRSWAITEGEVLHLLLVFLVMYGIMILGIIVLFVGVFVAFPMIYIMYAEVFRKLNNPLLVIEEGYE